MTGTDRFSLALAPRGATPSDAARSASDVLGRPTAELLASGGDHRQVPTNGRNGYGMPLVDLDPIVRGSSCTATPPDSIALAVAERWRADLLESTIRAGALPGHRELRRAVVAPLLQWLELDEDDDRRLVLTPSGTDAETIATAFALSHTDGRVRNVLVGAMEAGSGSAVAASGRYFGPRTPFRCEVTPGSPLDGFAADRVSVVDVELRDGRGRPRRAFDVEAEIEAHVEDALECRELVLVHAMAGSKTGLRQIDPVWVRTWKLRFPELRVIVDAAQGRCTPAEIRAFVDAGASVSLTGSKALSAPPFCGAMLLDDSLLADVEHLVEAGGALPVGLRDIVAAADLPEALVDLVVDPQPANLGLLARWHVALDEIGRLSALPAQDRELFTEALVEQLVVRLSGLRTVQLVPSPDPTPTIISFHILDATGEPMDKAALHEVYRSLTDHPGVQLGQPVELYAGGPAALRFAIGSTTITRALMTGASPVAQSAEVAQTVVDVLDENLPEPAFA
ncbi:MAG: hypothetical protein ACXWA9_15000 [Acidimicrobiia bacterium]